VNIVHVGFGPRDCEDRPSSFIGLDIVEYCIARRASDYTVVGAENYKTNSTKSLLYAA